MTGKIFFLETAYSGEGAVLKEPLIGSSGRMFSRMLRSAGLDRKDRMETDFRPDMARRGLRPLLWERSRHAFAAVFSFQLPHDDVAELCGPKQPGDDPCWRIPGLGWLRPEHRGHVSALPKAIKEAAPDVIVALGAVPLWALGFDLGITEARGIVLWSEIVGNIKVVPTLHPEHVIADIRMLPVVIADLIRAKQEAAEPNRTVNQHDIDLWLEPSLVDIEDWWRGFGSGATLLSVDIETAGNQIDCIGFAADNTHAICIPFVDKRASDGNFWPSAENELAALKLVADYLDSPVPKVFQNGSYDVAWIWGRYGLPVRNWSRDTRLMHHVRWAELPKDLAFMGSCYGNPPGAWKSWLRADKRWS